MITKRVFTNFNVCNIYTKKKKIYKNVGKDTIFKLLNKLKTTFFKTIFLQIF